ncbi:unnamed protein product [Brassicogethes aeneus]|uniref:Protein kinase domain-containing protein n=1 Tax=Brassicogethes aeneus TaxID=1431903 RepID=A0A9P0B4X4_BRAAE|nr:unnamed protein product [Brassicogethes aeneus]
MAVVGPSCHPRVSMSISMSLMQGTVGPAAGGQQGGLHAAQPYYHPAQHAAAPAHTQEQVQPDRPIGYGAFGVVWVARKPRLAIDYDPYANRYQYVPVRRIIQVEGAVTDPRDGRRVALKKLPNVFQSLVSSKRVFRELKMLCFFKHENLKKILDRLHLVATKCKKEQENLQRHYERSQATAEQRLRVLNSLLLNRKIAAAKKLTLRTLVIERSKLVNSKFYSCGGNVGYVITELLQSDLHKIIVSHQPLSSDHIKVFLYQILRGLKYLHSARILHRDIKPGNLLVNSNCVLKICDFGLARVEEPDANKHMTQEVVTQYYRAPEILMGAKHYNAAVDVWSVGCIFGELLGRRILFQAQNPVQQDKRITVVDALAHPYLDEGRLRYHSCMCKCCYTTASGMRQYTQEFESQAPTPFDDHWEKKLTSVQQVKAEQLNTSRVPLCINPQSAAFKSFASSTVAHPSELPPSPHQWD